MKNWAKKDYMHGLRLLKKASKENGFNTYIKIMSTNWIKPFSTYLAERNICATFWENVITQGNIVRIPKCVTVNDMLHGHGKCLFAWHLTRQGSDFWINIAEDMASDFGTIFDDITKLTYKYND